MGDTDKAETPPSALSEINYEGSYERGVKMPIDEDGNEIVEDEGDLLADLLDEEIAVEDGSAANDDELDALKTQVEDLNKERQGLLSATKDERRKRQEASSRLNQLEGAVSAILSQRQQQGIESLTETEAAGAKAQGIPVTYDEDGNGWIDNKVMTEMLTPYQEKIQELEKKLQHTNDTNAATDQADKIRQGIIGEDERFGLANGQYRAARKWVEDQVFDFAKANNVQRTINSGEALDYVFDSSLRKEFTEQFKDLSLMDIVTAEDSQEHFRQMLSNVADATNKDNLDLTSPKDKMDSRFQKVLNKPSTLGNQANAKAGQLTILEKVGNLNSSDIMDLSDDQIDALMKLASSEGV